MTTKISKREQDELDKLAAELAAEESKQPVETDNIESGENPDVNGESEPEQETLSERLARITQEKLDEIRKQEQALAQDKRAIELNVAHDVCRVMMFELVQNGFQVPDGIVLESGAEFALTIQYSEATGKFSMAVADSLPKTRTVTEPSSGDGARHTKWFTKFINPDGVTFDAPMLDGSDTRNDLAGCEKILGFGIKYDRKGNTMSTAAKQKRIEENKWTVETAQNF